MTKQEKFTENTKNLINKKLMERYLNIRNILKVIEERKGEKNEIINLCNKR